MPADRLSTAAPGVTAADVEAAARRLVDVVPVTPLTPNQRLSDRLAAQVFLKREDLQDVRSYKARGATNFIAGLDATARAAGVVCASAGNHAQGVARACAALGVHARIYLPRTTPRQKRERVAAIGGRWVEIVVEGDLYDDAASAALEESARTGATLVHAFDSVGTVAGQGTVVREAVGQLVDQVGRAPDVVVVPVGGGGLLAGTLAWLREEHPECRVVGVEPAGAASMRAALAAGAPVDLPTVDPFVDGAAVSRVGAVPFPIVRDSGCEVVSVPEGAVCIEMLELYQSDGIIAEPAGALASAALPALGVGPGQTVVAVLSGGNNDVTRYAEVVERALVHQGRKHYFLVEFPQEPGALRRFLDEVLGPDDDITLFEYVKHNNRETGPALVGIELGSPDDLPALLERMALAPPQIERVPPDSPLFRFIV
ncbi:MAG TPA: threonine ammonia-lyase IlvA [Intrasporangium sp.]|uniref:threonine ammonia-lyase IlvA n=1 Tax=Intrasporangium sp. TaxID=1925024 RepID=UPI002D770490|nr:threonine ammonia-lyase IlvA [Intrasporangium sp.]HET7397975.1 threonine ammonia-lyase IlvA [Intrasporangium sp.]